MIIPLNIHLTALSLASSDAARDVLINDSDKWFGWLVGSTVAVLVGVAFEAPEGIVDFIDWIGARRQLKWVRSRSGISSEEDPAHWTKAVSFIGLVLVVLGVCGEGVFEVLASRADSAVRSYDEKAIVAANEKAGSAKSSADGAVADLKIAQTTLDGLTTKAGILDSRMNTASSKLDAIDARLAWRRVSPAQFKSFSKALLPFKDSKVVIFVFSNEDEEAKTFASDLMRLLHDGAKWEPILNNTITAVPLPSYRLLCQLDTSTPAGKALADVMAKFPDVQIVPAKLPGTVGVIRVGMKPVP